MSKTILAEVEGWTPIVDELAKEYGLVRAAVFGRIWRFCQMPDGVCKASLKKISEDLGIDRATAMRHAQALADDGYLEDTTHNLRNHPHVYRDTGKAGLKISITTVAQRNTGVAESNSTVAQRNTGVAESQLKRVVKKQSNKVKEKSASKNDAPKRDSNLDNPGVLAFREITKRTPNEIQRLDICRAVNGNIDQWRETIKHWCGHGWNKTNVTGMLSLLQSGGVGACTQCNRTASNVNRNSNQSATLADMGIVNR